MRERSSRLGVALQLLALALLAAHLAAPLWPEASVWGLWPYTYLPGWLGWLLALAVALRIVVQMGRADAPSLWHTAARWLMVRGARRYALPLSLLAVPLFYAGRIVHTRWGDAYILTFGIPHPDARLTYSWQAPLDVFLHAKLWALGHRLWGWPDAMPVYWLLGPLAGAVFLYALFRLADLLGGNTTEKAVTFGLVASLGLMQFFFGYIENYVLMAAAMLIYYWLAVRCLRGSVPLVAPAAVLALCHALHPSSLMLLPSLAYLAWRHRPMAKGNWRRRAGGILALALSILLPYALIGGGTVALMAAGGHGPGALLATDRPGGGDGRWFVPLFETTTRWEHYTMFSWPHLRDILNESVLVAPATLPALALIALLAPRRLRAAWRAAPELRFFSVAAAFYLVLTVVWNPDYGGQRDWDLFAPAYLPATLLLACLLPRVLAGPRELAKAGGALVLVSLLHTAAWVYANTRPWAWPA